MGAIHQRQESWMLSVKFKLFFFPISSANSPAPYAIELLAVTEREFCLRFVGVSTCRTRRCVLNTMAFNSFVLDEQAQCRVEFCSSLQSR